MQFQNNTPNITPEQLNRQLTLCRFAMAGLTFLILLSCFLNTYNKRSDNGNSVNDYHFQAGEHTINMVPVDTLFDQELNNLIKNQNLPPEQSNVLKSISCQFKEEFYQNNRPPIINKIEDYTRLYILGKTLESFAEEIQADSILSHGFLTPNDYEQVKVFKNLAAELKEFKYK